MIFTMLGKALLKRLESCRLSAYQDQKLIWTIGWGHTGPEVVKGLLWTQDQADRALDRDITIFSIGLNTFTRNTGLNDNQYSALVIFVYNIGLKGFISSSVRTLLAMNNLADIPDHMKLWDKIMDPKTERLVIDNGLIIRRQAEIDLWNTPVSGSV